MHANAHFQIAQHLANFHFMCYCVGNFLCVLATLLNEGSKSETELNIKMIRAQRLAYHLIHTTREWNGRKEVCSLRLKSPTFLSIPKKHSKLTHLERTDRSGYLVLLTLTFWLNFLKGGVLSFFARERFS